MNLRLALPLFACLAAPALWAQTGEGVEAPTITHEAIGEPEPADDPDAPVYDVDEMPDFPGGQVALAKYMERKFTYPEAAVAQRVAGRVVVGFIIERDGSISQARAVRGIGAGCDEVAVGMIERMPKWKPGRKDGKAVRTPFTLHVDFSLADRAK